MFLKSYIIPPKVSHRFASLRQLKMADSPELSARKWKIVRYGQGSSKITYSVQVADREYRDETVYITMSRVGGLGLDLVEFVDNNNCALVMVNDIFEGSNAERPIAGGKFRVGDVLLGVSVPDGGEVKSLEGLLLDKVIKIISGYGEVEKIKLTIKRLTKRDEVIVKMVGPSREDAGSLKVLSGYGTNMRQMLVNSDMKVYDENTWRFDSPYQTGDCGGEGTCGTCVVAVLSGANLLNSRARVEDMALKKIDAPSNYRWACRTAVAPSFEHKGNVTIMLRPQTADY